jgi:hypothetical protein
MTKFKRGDIVMLTNHIKGRGEISEKRVRFSRIEIPEYLFDGVGKIIDIKPMYMFPYDTAFIERFKGKIGKEKIYEVFFLFDIDIEKKYISYHKDWFMEDELVLADKKEREFFLNLMEIIEAKEVAERL